MLNEPKSFRIEVQFENEIVQGVCEKKSRDVKNGWHVKG